MNKSAAAPLAPKRQRSQYTCMATSLSMCLEALGMQDADEDHVNKVMGAAPMQGASWEQAFAAAQHYGARTTLTCPATLAQVKAYTDRGIPVMIAWNPEGRPWSHASVIFDVDEENVHVADPNIPDPDQTVRVVPKVEFYGKWYEKFPDYLVRRPAMAVEREISPEGRQMVASKTAKPETVDPARNPYERERGTRNWGAGGHNTKPKDVERGTSRKEKHKKDYKEAEKLASRFLQAQEDGPKGKAKKGQFVVSFRTVENEDFPKGDRARGKTTSWTFLDAKSLDEVADTYRIEAKHSSGTPQGGNVYDDKGELVAWVSQNGRLFDPKNHNQALAKQGTYSGNSDGKPIYPNDIEHGYEEPIAGGTDIMRKLQNQLLHEQGNDDQMRPDSPRLAAAWETEEDDTPKADPYRECIAYLNANAVKFPRKSGWWIPAHNLAINVTLLGEIGLRQFSVLPWSPKRFGYKPATADHPEGIVLRPQWHMLNDPTLRDEFEGTVENAQRLLELAATRNTVGETLKAEFKWLEQNFHIDIPGDIVARWVQEAPKVAVRRWGVDILRMKDLFIPLDGSKPVEMDSLGTPRRASLLADRFIAKKGE